MGKQKVNLQWLASFLCVVSLLSAGFFLISAVWAFLIKAYVLMAVTICIFAVFLIFCVIKHLRSLFVAAALVLTLLIVFIAFGPVVKNVNDSIHSLCLKLWSKDPLPLFTMRDKAAIYGLNLAMGICVLAIYPEAGVKTLLMVLPPPKNEIRVFKSGFPAKSKVVSAAIEEYRKKLETNPAIGAEWSKPVHVHWHLSDYPMGMPEAKYALTLNASNVSFRTKKVKEKNVMEVRVEVRIEYPRDMKVVLIRDPGLKLDEGLFWVIQKCNWLHGYTARWEFEIRA